MPRSSSPRAVAQALVVTFLWSTSWVLIKHTLDDVPPLTFAGLRFSLAALCLVPLGLRSSYRDALRQLAPRDWGRLAVLGVLLYGVTQGAQFLGLAVLPAVTVSLLLNATPAVVALLGGVLLAERPGARQWAGVGLCLLGGAVYFLPVALPAGQLVGLGAVALGVLANAGSALLGRTVNRTAHLPAPLVTVVSMVVGAPALLLAGLATQGLPPLSATSWAVIAWLAVVNTAFAFTLWNHTLRTLTATESSIINSTMLVQIALLAWLFLGEGLTWRRGLGLGLAGLGTLLVQLRHLPRRRQGAQEATAA
jgi:drug/metabolite transporter (DMT)-like permease